MFETVTVIGVDRVWLPCASRATAVITCAPLLTPTEAQLKEYGADTSSLPTGTESISNCTPTTPTASDASAVRFTMPDTCAPSAGAVMLTAGGVTSVATTALTSFDA